MTVRQYLGNVIAALGLLLLCIARASAESGTQISVQLNWKHQFEFAAFYAALHKGYYRDAGLDVVILEGGPGIDAVKEVVDGRADFGVGTSALVVDRHRGFPVVALATLMQHSPVALLAPRKPGIESVHDLAGKTIAVDPHTRDETEAFLRAVGLAGGSVRFTDQTDWTIDSLTQGREAAKVVYVSNETYWIRGREHEYLLLSPARPASTCSAICCSPPRHESGRRAAPWPLFAGRRCRAWCMRLNMRKKSPT